MVACAHHTPRCVAGVNNRWHEMYHLFLACDVTRVNTWTRMIPLRSVYESTMRSWWFNLPQTAVDDDSWCGEYECLQHGIILWIFVGWWCGGWWSEHIRTIHMTTGVAQMDSHPTRIRWRARMAQLWLSSSCRWTLDVYLVLPGW